MRATHLHRCDTLCAYCQLYCTYYIISGQTVLSRQISAQPPVNCKAAACKDLKLACAGIGIKAALQHCQALPVCLWLPCGCAATLWSQPRYTQRERRAPLHPTEGRRSTCQTSRETLTDAGSTAQQAARGTPQHSTVRHGPVQVAPLPVSLGHGKIDRYVYACPGQEKAIATAPSSTQAPQARRQRRLGAPAAGQGRTARLKRARPPLANLTTDTVTRGHRSRAHECSAHAEAACTAHLKTRGRLR